MISALTLAITAHDIQQLNSGGQSASLVQRRRVVSQDNRASYCTSYVHYAAANLLHLLMCSHAVSNSMTSMT